MIKIKCHYPETIDWIKIMHFPQKIRIRLNFSILIRSNVSLYGDGRSNVTSLYFMVIANILSGFKLIIGLVSDCAKIYLRACQLDIKDE